MTIQIIQTIYVFLGLLGIFVLTSIWEPKNACPCKVRVPMSIFALFTTIVISIILPFNKLAIMFIPLIVCGMLGSALFPRSKIAGGIIFLLGYLASFTIAELLNFVNMFEQSIDNMSIYGALIAITLMSLKKQDALMTLYIIGLGLFFVVGLSTLNLIIITSSVLWTLSEIMLIFSNDYAGSKTGIPQKKLAYFSAELYSFAVVLLPVALLQ